MRVNGVSGLDISERKGGEGGGGGGQRPVVQDTRGASLTSPHLCTAERQLHGGQKVGARTDKRGQLAEL